MSPPPVRDRSEWWRTAVVYQIYPRSFADSNGDGIGDLPGVISRLDYLEDLGIDAIWMSPFYPSPLADGGYDVTDYCDVDPRLGRLGDFVQLVEQAHRRGIKVIIDIVPNHTSTEHPWFLEALASSPGSAARDRYIFRDSDDGGPPTDWLSHFGGSAWEQVADGQWYCHLFDSTQPDLNWGNPEIRAYFLSVLRFWADIGVDGFRVDVAHSLAKDLSEPLRSQPTLDRALPSDGTDPLYDREEVHAIYREWRYVFNEYDPPRMAVAETWTPASARTYLYGRADELGQVFDFSLLKSDWGADEYRRTIQTSIEGHRSLAGNAGGITWVLSNHDVPRHASRLALPQGVTGEEWLLSHGREPIVDNDLGLRRARSATLMMLALPGSAYLYQGEELGLREVFELDTDDLRDPVWLRSAGAVKGRDGCRVPLPWSSTDHAYGFSTGTPWLPQPADWASVAVDVQSHLPDSTLAFYRAALRLRHDVVALSDTDFAWLDSPPGVLAFARSASFRCVVNFTDRPIPLDLADGDSVRLASAGLIGGHVPAEGAAWVFSPGSPDAADADAGSTYDERSMADRREPVTIYKVARTAGVSIATVSRALNEPVKVRPATLERILHAVRDLNYVPDVAAQSMARALGRKR